MDRIVGGANVPLLPEVEEAVEFVMAVPILIRRGFLQIRRGIFCFNHRAEVNKVDIKGEDD